MFISHPSEYLNGGNVLIISSAPQVISPLDETPMPNLDVQSDAKSVNHTELPSNEDAPLIEDHNTAKIEADNSRKDQFNELVMNGTSLLDTVGNTEVQEIK